MIKNKYLGLCLFSFLLGFSGCSKEEPELNEEPHPDQYDNLEFHFIEYDFSKKEIKEVQSPEFKESFENNTDQIITISIYPYFNQGTMEFSMEEMGNFLDGLECEVPVPKYENDSWSEIQTITVKSSFGTIWNFNPYNGNFSFTINADSWKTTKYGYTLTFSELTIPFEAIFVGSNYGWEYSCKGILKIRTPINYNIKLEEQNINK